MNNKTNHYEETMRDLELRRATSLQELTKLDQAISALRATMTVSQPVTETVAVHIARPSDWKQEYANMSVRWAILKLLAEGGGPLGRPMKSAEISEELTGGGNEKASKATVSAVISDMVKKRQELERQEVEQSEDGGYQLTETGKHAWNAIKHSSKYVNRALSATTQ
jgi:hypothetical protein